MRIYEDGIFIYVVPGGETFILRGEWHLEGNKLISVINGVSITYEIINYTRNSFKAKLGNIEGLVRWDRIPDSVIDQYLKTPLDILFPMK